MAQTTDPILDKVCEVIAECRHEGAEIKRTEKGEIDRGLRRLRERGEWGYVRHGIRLTRTQEEHLSVRVVKASAIATQDDETPLVDDASDDADMAEDDADGDEPTFAE